MIDMNHGSGAVIGSSSATETITRRITALIDAALIERYSAQAPRTYLGGSRIGEPCSRRLVYEFTRTPVDERRRYDGRGLRIFDVGHYFETLSIRWLREAGFDLRTHRTDGEQFGFSAATGRFRGHIDGVIVDGPDIGVAWPVLFEHKAVNSRTWADIARSGVQRSKPLYYGQLQIYLAYMELETALFTALNKDTQALHHEIVAFDARAAQALSDKAVDVIQAAESGELPRRVTDYPDSFVCRWCPYAERCWKGPV
jgi:hypothetical protein